MSPGKKTAFAIVLTVFYSGIWFTMLFLIVGFFMPNPVRFCKSIRGNGGYTYKNNNSSKYGLSDDPEVDEMLYYDEIVDDD